MVIFMELMKPFESFTPKFHLVFHALEETAEKGNPWHYSSWFDEHLNKCVKQCCKHASQITFNETVLMKTLEVLRAEPTCKKRRQEAFRSQASD